MKYSIQLTDTPKSDVELYAGVLEVIKLADVPLAAKVRAIRGLASFSAHLSQFEASTIGYHIDRTPIIKPPLDPEPGFDQIWRLLWRTN